MSADLLLLKEVEQTCFISFFLRIIQFFAQGYFEGTTGHHSCLVLYKKRDTIEK